MSKQINLEFKIEQEALLLEFLYQNLKLRVDKKQKI